MTVNELERIEKDMTVPYFKPLSQSEGYKENAQSKSEPRMITYLFQSSDGML
jgi:hypothetical protein